MRFLQLVLLLLSCFPAIAQEDKRALSGRDALLSLSGQLREHTSRLREQAVSLARKKGWAESRELPGGGRLLLERVDALGLPVYKVNNDNIRSAATTGTDLLWPGGASGLNLQGSSAFLSSRLAIWDGSAIRASHQEFQGRILQKDRGLPAAVHSTHVAGTLIARGINRPARGMAFGLPRMIAYDFLNDNAEMAEEAPTLLVSNHSYGALAGWDYNHSRDRWEWHGEPGQTRDYKFGYYDETASQWDRIAFEAPYYLIVKSAGNNRNVNGPGAGSEYYRYNEQGELVRAQSGAPFPSRNDGYDILPLYANAKNILLVGAVNPLPGGHNASSEVMMTPFSSWGPTDDGRIKPDVMGNGVGVLSSSSEANDAYTILSGSSMSAPNVAGSLILLQELYALRNEGRFMRSASLRGLAIHTAREAGSAPGPDYRFGWGLFHAGAAAEVIRGTGGEHLLVESELEQGTENVHELVSNGYKPLEITLCWTDPEAQPVPEREALDNPSPRLVNDLDIRLLDENGEVTGLPWVLDPANPGAPAGPGDNVLDNVEKIYFSNPGYGKSYTVQVSHKAELERGPQAYSLIVSGTGGKRYCGSAAQSAEGLKIAALQIGAYQYTAGAGCLPYIDLLGERVQAAAGSSLPFSIQTSFCGRPETHALKIFADWNNDGNFTEATETVFSSALLDGAGTITGNMGVPAGLPPGIFIRLRIVAMHTTDLASLTACGNYTYGESLDISLAISAPATDLSMENLLDPGVAALCPGQPAVLRALVRNRGSETRDSIPLRARIYRGQILEAELEGLFEAPLESGDTAVYAFPRRFLPAPDTEYRFVLEVLHPEDQVTGNNGIERVRRSLAASAPAANVQAFICESDRLAALIAPGQQTVYWYDQAEGGNFLGTGDTLLLNFPGQPPAFYAGLNDFRGTAGPLERNASPLSAGGSYVPATAEISLETTAPLLIESARFYTGYPGKISLTVFDEKGTEVSRRILHVPASSSQALEGMRAVDALDTGRVHALDLQLPRPGLYTLRIDAEGTGASLYESQEELQESFGIPGLLRIQSPHHYLFSWQVRALGCGSARSRANVRPLPTPQIWREGDTLFTDGIAPRQWLLNGEVLPGATGSYLVADREGSYQVSSWLGACTAASESFSFSLLEDVIARLPERGLNVYPNPGPVQNDAPLHVEFYARYNEETELLIYDPQGKMVHRYSPNLNSGKNILTLALDNYPPGIYVLQLKIENEAFGRKFIVLR